MRIEKAKHMIMKTKTPSNVYESLASVIKNIVFALASSINTTSIHAMKDLLRREGPDMGSTPM
jgi:hypothetical protein